MTLVNSPLTKLAFIEIDGEKYELEVPIWAECIYIELNVLLASSKYGMFDPVGHLIGDAPLYPAINDYDGMVIQL